MLFLTVSEFHVDVLCALVKAVKCKWFATSLIVTKFVRVFNDP